MSNTVRTVSSVTRRRWAVFCKQENNMAATIVYLYFFWKDGMMEQEASCRCQLYLPRIMVIVHTLARDLFTAWCHNLLSLIGNFRETYYSSSVEYFLHFNMTVRGKLFTEHRRCGHCCFNNSVFTYPIGPWVSLMSDAKPLSLKRQPIPWLCLHVCGSSLSDQLFTTWRERGCVGNLGEFPVCAMLPHFQHIGSLSVCLVKTSVCVRRALDKGPVYVCVLCVHTVIICVYSHACVFYGGFLGSLCLSFSFWLFLSHGKI